ncbi:MAG TPA: class I SAM-dependent DNA methyltransferase, partial [Candidatus Kapabacteria bacterium]|nr:class I SAM-dependent DNA methyltransferase [Candidatus Kapabacteria bacterium]
MTEKNPLEKFIDNCQVQDLHNWLRDKNYKFAQFVNNVDFPLKESNFQNSKGEQIFDSPLQVGEIELDNASNMEFFLIRSSKPITERTSKKNQFEIGKDILKKMNADAGLFIFYYDDKAKNQKNYRFSLIFASYFGTKRTFSTYKRFTYLVSSDKQYNTFLNYVGNCKFSSIDEIKEAFSVEPITKQFYAEIQNWYFWALKNVKFPKNSEAEKNGKNIELIRIITRIIFIWFMKEKKLIKNDLFEKNEIKNLLKTIADEDSSYYKAILQNLFFATLNTPIKERKFRREEKYQGKNPDYMKHNYYRYHILFNNPDDMLTIFKDIPFLNGGLFECLDKAKNDPSNKENEEIRIDGFSDEEKNQAIFPNFLFFSDEIEVDLNKDYGTISKKYKVRGLINILQSYNFTVDENSPIDQDIALDPELLGKVFENLLAAYNPETATTARKATGSYYTPREIVDYMV